jgi:ABC-type ATPase with predicted acetyltransferase domain
MDHFGIGFETGRHVIAEDFELPIETGQIVLCTGASGSGKSSLMQAVAAQLRSERQVEDIDDLDLGDQLLIDSLPGETAEAMQWLAQCGLGEARLLLRSPSELSDGQRYRFRLALGLSRKPDWLVADEFTATLDRTLARVIAFNLRRLADRTGTGFLLATTHEDVVDDLQPDVHIVCRLDGTIQVHRRNEIVADEPAGTDLPTALKKKDSSRSRTTCGSAAAPNATGRISLGGITGATPSA